MSYISTPIGNTGGGIMAANCVREMSYVSRFFTGRFTWDIFCFQGPLPQKDGSAGERLLSFPSLAAGVDAGSREHRRASNVHVAEPL